MSDYPMLISNKLHSFRNFFSANLLIFCGTGKSVSGYYDSGCGLYSVKYKNSAKLFFIEYNYVRAGMNLSNYFRHGIIRVITVTFNIIRDCPCNPCLK